MPDPDLVADLYSQRDRLVANLAARHPSAIGTDPAEPDWPVVYIESEAGQMAWHIAVSELPLFAHVPRSDTVEWDGHTTEEKYRRLDNLTRTIAARGATA
jgi:hypothetical protein